MELMAGKLLAGNNGSWRVLPPEVIELLAANITSVLSYVRFRAVCPEWRRFSAAKPQHLPPQVPWILLPHNMKQAEDGETTFYDIETQQKLTVRKPDTIGMMCCGADRGWLFYMADEGRKAFLLNPISNNTVKLPPFTSGATRLIENRPNSRYTIHHTFNTDDGRYIITRLILSCNPHDPQCLVLLFIKKTGTIIFCNAKDAQWSIAYVETLLVGRIEDCTYFSGSFYHIQSGHLTITERSSPEPPLVEKVEALQGVTSLFVRSYQAGLYILRIKQEREVGGQEEPRTGPKEEFQLLKLVQKEPLQLQEVSGEDSILFTGENCGPLSIRSDDWDPHYGGWNFQIRKNNGGTYSLYRAQKETGLIVPVESQLRLHFPRVTATASTLMWFRPTFT